MKCPYCKGRLGFDDETSRELRDSLLASPNDGIRTRRRTTNCCGHEVNLVVKLEVVILDSSL